jgi:hypothetical protein
VSSLGVIEPRLRPTFQRDLALACPRRQLQLAQKASNLKPDSRKQKPGGQIRAQSHDFWFLPLFSLGDARTFIALGSGHRVAAPTARRSRFRRNQCIASSYNDLAPSLSSRLQLIGRPDMTSA